MLILKRFLNQYRDHQAPIPRGLTPKKLINTFPGFCVFSKFAYGEVQNPLKLYRGKDCVGKFCGYIRQEANRLYHMFPEKPMDPLTKEQLTRYKEATKCHICYKPFDSKNCKVRDHCHYTGRYRGPAHRTCTQELQFEISNPINNNNKKRSHTQLDSRKQVIAFQDRVITINIKEAQNPLK